MALDLSRRVEALLQIEPAPNFSNVGRKYMLFRWTKKLTSEREKRIFKRDLLRADVYKYRPEVGKMKFSKNPKKIM